MISVLFVCTGNICRSPTAEAVFKDKVKNDSGEFKCDSAGTHAYHTGEPPDYRSIQVAQKKGVEMSNLVARKLRPDDFEIFDLLIAMDKGHEQIMIELAEKPEYHKKIKLLLDYDDQHRGMDMPDPYYGTMQDFENTYNLIEKGINALIAQEC